MEKDIFNLTSANELKLVNYGFIKQENNYKYSTIILNGQFILNIFISNKNDVSTKLIDTETNDEYVLHLIEENQGEFIGKVRDDIEKVLQDVKEKCFEKEIYKVNKQNKY